MELSRKSEYVCSLSAEARKRYSSKVITAGLHADPYTLEDWTQNPETIPAIQWSDLMLYMVSTPSPYTKESIKVSAILLA